MKIGIVTASNPSTGKVRVQFADQDGVVSDWLPVVQKKTLKDKSYHMPDLGEHVVCLLDENEDSGVVLGAIYSDADAVPVGSQDKWHHVFDDGTSIEYDRAAHKLTADVKGDVDIKTTGTIVSDSQGAVTIKSSVGITLMAPGVNMVSYGGGATAGTITGTLHVSGDIKGDAEVIDSVRAMSGDRAIYNGHTHPDPQGGAVSPPNQPQ